MTDRFAPSPSTDLAREIPDHPGARLDAAQAAVTLLRREEHRLARLGLETPLARCHQQRRTWEFLAALVALPAWPASTASEPSTWPAEPRD